MEKIVVVVIPNPGLAHRVHERLEVLQHHIVVHFHSAYWYSASNFLTKESPLQTDLTVPAFVDIALSLPKQIHLGGRPAMSGQNMQPRHRTSYSRAYSDDVELATHYD